MNDLIQKETERCLKAVDDEPELPGKMPDEIWNRIKNNREEMEKLCRICCSETKDGIRKRILDKRSWWKRLLSLENTEATNFGANKTS